MSQLNSRPRGLIWSGGVPYCWRSAYPDEQPNCAGYVLVSFFHGEPVAKVTPEMVKLVEADLRLQQWKKSMAKGATA